MAKNLASAATSQAPCSSAHARIQALGLSCSGSFIAAMCSAQDTLWQCFIQSLQNHLLLPANALPVCSSAMRRSMQAWHCRCHQGTC